MQGEEDPNLYLSNLSSIYIFGVKVFRRYVVVGWFMPRTLGSLDRFV